MKSDRLEHIDMSNQMQDYIKLLQYPFNYFSGHCKTSRCQHGGFYNALAKDCRSCQDGNRCQWLNTHHQFVNLEQRSLRELKTAIDQAIFLISHDIEQHAIDCYCDACQWFENVVCLRFIEELFPLDEAALETSH